MGERKGERENTIETFKEEFSNGLEQTIEMAEIFQESVSIDPITMGIGEKNYEELTFEEKNIAKQIILSNLGLKEEDLKTPLREYLTIAPENATVLGEIKVSVFKTNREDKGVFLQRLTFIDEEERWAVGPDQDI